MKDEESHSQLNENSKTMSDIMKNTSLKRPASSSIKLDISRLDKNSQITKKILKQSANALSADSNKWYLM